jgi:hypothetical protein
VLTLTALLAIGYLPGAVIFRLPAGDRARRAGLDAGERLFWQVVISLAISLALVVALAAAGGYSFGRLLAGDALVAIAAAVAARFHLRLEAARRPDAWMLVPLALAAVGMLRFFPPSEYIIGGKDPGTYINEGIQIAQRGALRPADPVVAAVPNFARDLFFPSYQRPDYYSSRFMGFFIVEPEQGHVVGQFPHLFPASIAIGYGLDGLTGARRATGVWAILGLLAVYFAGSRLFGRVPATAAAGLLALHVVQVWFSRYPNAEVVMQALLFAALLAGARAQVDGDRFFGPVAGALLGLLLFLRFDAVLAVAGMGAGAALGAVAGQKPRWGFLITLGAAALLAAWYLLGPMYPYAYLPIVFLSHLPWWAYPALALGAALAVAALAVGARNPGLSADVRRLTPPAISALLLAAAVYALWFRHPGGRLTDYDAYALRTFSSLYVTLPALLAALAGFALAARRQFWRDPALFCTVAIFAFSVFYKIRIVPEHFWMARRFLPVILPGALLFAASLALSGLTAGPRVRRLASGALGGVFLVLLALQYERASRPILAHVEYAGIIPKLEQIAELVHDDDLLIVESRDASDTHVLALPLAYIYARDVLVLASRLPDKSLFADFLDWAHTRYRRVLFMGGGGTDLLSRRWTVTPIAGDRFQVPEYEAARSVYPRAPRAKEFDYSIYEFRAGGAAPEGPIDLDLGLEDDLHVLRFHAKETTGGRTFRWSRDVSYVSMASLPAASRTVTITMSDGGRPAAAGPAEVSVFLEFGYRAGEAPERSVPLGTVTAARGFTPYTFGIPADAARMAAESGTPARLKIVSSTWNPAHLLGVPDDRDLGVMVDRVAIEQGGAAGPPGRAR